jgi:hypothetical protein
VRFEAACALVIEAGLAKVGSQFNSNNARSKAQNIHIIVFHPLMSRIGVMAQVGINSLHFISGNAGAHRLNMDAVTRYVHLGN